MGNNDRLPKLQRVIEELPAGFEGAPSTTRLVTMNAAPASIPFWESLSFVPDACDGQTHILQLYKRLLPK